MARIKGTTTAIVAHYSVQVYFLGVVFTILQSMRFCQKEDGSSSSSLCSRCKAMTTTVTGLKQLFSRKGYLHPYPAIKNGVSQGCPFCTFLQELALLRSEEVPYPVCISCTFLVDGSNEFNNLVYRESSCSDDQFQSLYKMLPPMAFRPGMYLSLQGHVYGPDYCASLDVNTLTGIPSMKPTVF